MFGVKYVGDLHYTALPPPLPGCGLRQKERPEKKHEGWRIILDLHPSPPPFMSTLTQITCDVLLPTRCFAGLNVARGQKRIDACLVGLVV